VIVVGKTRIHVLLSFLAEGLHALQDLFGFVRQQKSLYATFKVRACEAVFSKLQVLPHVIVLSMFVYSPFHLVVVRRPGTP